MEDLTWDGLESDEHEEEEEEEAYEEEQCEGDQDEDLKGDEILVPINRPHPETSLPASSPKRKRARITTSYPLPIEYTNLMTKISITFEQFDDLPIRARSKGIWNKLLLANPDFWEVKCNTWTWRLSEAFEARNKVRIYLIYLPSPMDKGRLNQRSSLRSMQMLISN